MCSCPHLADRMGEQDQAVLVLSHSGYRLGQLVRSVPQAAQLGVRSAQVGYQVAPSSIQVQHQVVFPQWY